MNPYKICLSLYGTTEEIVDMIMDSAEADLFEIRVDLSRELDVIRFRNATSKPLIFTAHERTDLLRPFASSADYLDSGTVAMTGAAKKIASYHGSNENPESVWNTLKNADVKKLVLKTEDYSTISRLLALNLRDRAVCFAMGEVGQFSRIVSLFRGAEWMYASYGHRPTADGQFDLRSLVDIYRLHRFSKPPEVFGIIGNPVSHSKSPEFHNRRFAEAKQNRIYLPFLCKDLEGLMHHAPEFGVRGFSITHPFKEKILPLLHHRSAELQKVNACNTVCEIDGQWHGTNTDVAGVEAILLRLKVNLPESKIMIIGAGGAARAVAAVVAGKAQEIIILNRSAGKARALAAEFHARAGNLNEFGRHEYDLLFQTTPVGMQKPDSPIPLDLLKPGKKVVDLIYEPGETAILEKAKSLGCQTINGELWFRAQAEAQHQWWQSKIAPQARSNH